MLIELNKPIEIPAELDDDTRKILGTSSFTIICQLMRAAGETIARKAEAEQAAYIHFCLAARAKFGATWSKDAMTLLREKIKAQKIVT